MFCHPLITECVLVSAGEDIVHALSESYPLAAMLVRFLDRHLDFSEKTLRGQVNPTHGVILMNDEDSNVNEFEC